jgi:DNA-binding MarR family transcriptional regulator
MSNQTNNLEKRVLCSLRRIIRSVDIYSRQLNSEVGLTSPQLICLQSVVQADNSTLTMLTKAVSLSGSTVTGIVDRLETKGLLVRERATSDRRKIYLRPTTEGVEIVKASPSLLQDKFAASLGDLETNEQVKIAESLEHIVELMEAKDIDASPNLIPNPPMGL